MIDFMYNFKHRENLVQWHSKILYRLHPETTIINTVPHYKIFHNVYTRMFILLLILDFQWRHYQTLFFKMSSSNIEEFIEYDMHNYNTSTSPKKINNLKVTLNIWCIFKLSQLSPKYFCNIYSNQRPTKSDIKLDCHVTFVTLI